VSPNWRRSGFRQICVLIIMKFKKLVQNLLVSPNWRRSCRQFHWRHSCRAHVQECRHFLRSVISSFSNYRSLLQKSPIKETIFCKSNYLHAINYSLLYLECHFFILKSQTMFLFSRSLLPRSVEKRPRRLRLEIEFEWHSKCNRLYMERDLHVYEKRPTHMWKETNEIICYTYP